jgi:hypothetical protein
MVNIEDPGLLGYYVVSINLCFQTLKKIHCLHPQGLVLELSIRLHSKTLGFSKKDKTHYGNLRLRNPQNP